MYRVQNICSIIILALFLAACGGGAPTDQGEEPPPPPPPPPPQEDTTPPAPPNGLAGSSESEQVILNWNENGENDLAGYNLYRAEESFSTAPSEPANGGTLLSETDFTDESLQNGKTYYYRLTAVDTNDNESALSAELEITPFSDPPVRPKK